MRRLWRLVLPLAAVGIVAVIPTEKTLGGWIRWVYLHAAFDAVALIGFYAAALLGIGFLLFKTETLYTWATALWKAGTLSWAAGWIIGTVLGIVLWGGWTTAEPRNLLAPAILLLGIGGWLVASNLANQKASAYTYIIGSLLIWAALTFTGKVIHPLNPIGSGTSLMKFAYGGLMLVIALIGLEVARFLAVQEE